MCHLFIFIFTLNFFTHIFKFTNNYIYDYDIIIINHHHHHQNIQK